MGGYQDILYLIGLTYGKRDFFEVVDRIGTDALFAKAPYGDLTQDQRDTFEAAFNLSAVRDHVASWWTLYDNLRATGQIPDVMAWMPNGLEG